MLTSSLITLLISFITLCLGNKVYLYLLDQKGPDQNNMTMSMIIVMSIVISLMVSYCTCLKDLIYYSIILSILLFLLRPKKTIYILAFYVILITTTADITYSIINRY
jgi:hypothetical protein